MQHAHVELPAPPPAIHPSIILSNALPVTKVTNMVCPLLWRLIGKTLAPPRMRIGGHVCVLVATYAYWLPRMRIGCHVCVLVG